jgi:hypothetical protein
MGVYDELTIEYSAFPHPPETVYQAYFDLEDSYGDFYRVDETGQLWRLSRGAGHSQTYGRLDPPELLIYNDTALEIYGSNWDDGPIIIFSYILTFAHGRLTAWRENP